MVKLLDVNISRKNSPQNYFINHPHFPIATLLLSVFRITLFFHSIIFPPIWSVVICKTMTQIQIK